MLMKLAERVVENKKIIVILKALDLYYKMDNNKLFKY